MGFLQKSLTPTIESGQKRRNRWGYHPASMNPSSDGGGALNPVHQSMPATPVAPAAAAPVATTGAFPDNDAPVRATVYFPGQEVAATATATATAYAPPPRRLSSGTSTVASSIDGALEVPATVVHNPNNIHEHEPPAETTSPSYGRPQLNQRAPSLNIGNGNYNTSENTFWECSVCTFPNMRTDPTCRGCGGAIPPGLFVDTTPTTPAMNRPRMGGAGSMAGTTTAPSSSRGCEADVGRSNGRRGWGALRKYVRSRP
mmetsp:Transcript_39736/g.67734  ORF Transcript_39736/g.67734 Transcript_39736/m.67734 type:complete len:257 (+) Transcript_39736:73-843(+)